MYLLFHGANPVTAAKHPDVCKKGEAGMWKHVSKPTAGRESLKVCILG
jgi:hypothetical protein